MLKKIPSVGVILASILLTITGSPLRAQTQTPAAPKDVIASLQPFINNHTLAGAVLLVASKDKILSLEAIGYADIAAKVPMRTDNVFWIASMSKAITTTALMMLVDEGKVKVDDPVEKYLPGFSSVMVAVERDKDHVLLKKPAHPITVWNILTMTSGLEPVTPIEAGHFDLLPLRDNVLLYPLSPLQFEPGTRYRYCNAGINTAARIVELVSGMTFDKFQQERLFTPLGMKDTTYWPSEAQLKRLAKTYLVEEGKPGCQEIPIIYLSHPLTNRQRGVFPAGGLFSTAEDIGKFCQMMLNKGVFQGKTYLSEVAVRQMTTTQFPFSAKSERGYGFGWHYWQKDRGPGNFAELGRFEHGGAFWTNMVIDRPHNLLSVLMVQYKGPRSIKDKFYDAYLKAVDAAFIQKGAANKLTTLTYGP